MTFSAETKTELCRAPMERACCRLAELYGILLCAPAFSDSEIRVSSSHAGLVRRAALLLSKVFDIRVRPECAGSRQTLRISDAEQLRRILSGFGYDFKPSITYHLNRNILENDCCAAAFLRGTFLMAGSVAGPDKKSHLELKISHSALARELMSLMLDSGISPRSTERAACSLIYLKGTAGIEDFLTLTGASRAAMSIMEAKVEKSLRNRVNRQVNCETANINKTVSAAVGQINDIKLIRNKIGLEKLPEDLEQTALVRLEHPDATLKELGDLLSPPVGKSGVNHRLRKLKVIADSIRGNEEEQYGNKDNQTWQSGGT